MLDTIIDIATSVFIVTVLLMLLTAPGWITGKVVAAKRRALPVPVILRLKSLRWGIWFGLGAASLVLFVLTFRPIGTFEEGTRAIMASSGLLAYAGAGVVAFYIGWTASARKRARKAERESAPQPMPQGAFLGAEEDRGRVLPSPGDAENDYAPARPKDEVYPPARPLEE